MKNRLQILLFAALLMGLASLAYGLNYLYYSDIEVTVFGERVKFWHGDTLDGPIRSNDQIAIMMDPQFLDYVITSAPDLYHGQAYNPNFNGWPVIVNSPLLDLPPQATWLRQQAAAQGHFFDHGDSMQARVHVADDQLEIWWSPLGMPFDTAVFTTYALPESAIVFFDVPELHLWGTVGTTLILGCAGRAGLEDNILYGSSIVEEHGRIIPDHSEKFALVSEGEIKILNTWANGRENSNGQGTNSTNPDSSDICLNGFYFALTGSFTFAQQNDADSGYVYQVNGQAHMDDRGTMYLWGGLANHQRGYFHRSSNGSSGYLKRWHYDNALRDWRIGVHPDSLRVDVLNRSSLDFGAVNAGETVTDTIEVLNDYAPARVESFVVNAPFSATSVFTPQSSLSAFLVVDFAPTAGGDFHDTLRAFDSYFQRWLTVPLHGVGVSMAADPDGALKPAAFALSAAPNPFNAQTRIAFSLPTAGRAELAVFDVTGRTVKTLLSDISSAGTHTLLLDAADLPSGVYIARLNAGGAVRTQKLLLIK